MTLESLCEKYGVIRVSDDRIWRLSQIEAILSAGSVDLIWRLLSGDVWTGLEMSLSVKAAIGSGIYEEKVVG